MGGNWKTDPISKRTADRLRQDSLSLADGDFIGAEEDLRLRYGVSRPTLRLAAGIVSQDQLVRIRRGVNGGYFAARPTAGAVTRAASIFLHAAGASIEHLLDASTPIRIEVARLAALSDDPGLHEKLGEFLKQDADLIAEPFDYVEFVRADRRFWATLAAGCGNPVLQLYMEILLSLVSRTVEPAQDPVLGKPSRLEGVINRRRRVIQAVLEGDSEMAALAARRSTVDSDLAKGTRLTMPTEEAGARWS